MTTRDPDDIKSAGKKGKVTDRPHMSTPSRTEPIRSGAAIPPSSTAASQPPPDSAAHPAFPDPPNACGSSAAPPHSSFDLPISDAVANAVKTSNDVLNETLEQVRVAAEKFRQGDYNYREVPGDIEKMGIRLLQLARQLSSATFDICEQLLHEIASNKWVSQPDQSMKVPPFPATGAADDMQSSTQAPPSSVSRKADTIALTVQFEGKAKAKAHTTELARPTKPTLADQITATLLSLSSGKDNAVENISFYADVSQAGLIAKIAIPAGQPPGIYSGLVQSTQQDIPLGMLVIEIVK